MIYVLLVLAGAILCNSIPHLTSGLRGERFFTPWARPRGTGKSSAVENFIWGAANLFSGVTIIVLCHTETFPYGTMAAAAGFFITGVGLSIAFSHPAEPPRPAARTNRRQKA